MSLLELSDVVRRFHVRRGPLRAPLIVEAVAGVSFTVEPGRTLAIIGESGCGKSTTGRMALGMEAPDAGEVRFEGAPMPPLGSAAWRRLRRRMQMVFQDPLGALDKRLPIGRQISEPLDIHRIGTPPERQDRVAVLLDAVGLRPDQAHHYPHELSGGQRQRAVLARALASDPVLLVCDEPVSALDVSTQAQVVNLLIDLQAERHLALVFISHDLKLVRQIGERVLVLYLGRVVEEGAPEAVLHAPAHPYTRALVSAIPEPGERHVPRAMIGGEIPDPSARPTGCPFHPRCPIAVPLCRAELPPLKPLSASQSVACHLAHGDAAPPTVRTAA
ncbi:MAG TPA: oligopeptide/dipeptide ABC transporter ATP-binding protein [Acetobacteraceae bacterium]|nr:oligopeptide/dipeptide ABC transporter ATP-binding protein [Acetobacteraceae bacterium]